MFNYLIQIPEMINVITGSCNLMYPFFLKSDSPLDGVSYFPYNNFKLFIFLVFKKAFSDPG